MGCQKRLDDYLRQCERFWKDRHERTYEKKLSQIDEAKQRVIKIYALAGFDACYALLLALKHLRAILPLAHYPEYAQAIKEFEAIKEDCQERLGAFIGKESKDNKEVKPS
jgi:hypothetical protein